MPASQVRYVRYLVFAAIGLLLFFLLSKSSIPGLSPSKFKGSFTHFLSSNKVPEAAEEASHTAPKVITPFHPLPRVNATFVALSQNSDIWEIASSIRQVEDRFNHNYHYDWVFLNDKEFDDDFKRITNSLVSGNAYYGVIPDEFWSYPDWIDQDRASEVREEMKEKKIIYGESESYRHMCRYESGFFFRHPLLDSYEFYWRVEPGVELFCDVSFDPFRHMKENDKKYSFVISLYEYYDTIPTLWPTVKNFMSSYPQHIAEGNSMDFLSDDGGKTYNKCHFWSNFEIASLDWLRSKEYLEYFDYLDRQGGFYYERWGDAPVHSIAAGLLLKKEQIQFWNEIAYYHIPFTHCPVDEELRLELKCQCDPKDSVDWRRYSCLSRYYRLHNIPRPPGYEEFNWLAALGGVILLTLVIGGIVNAINPRIRLLVIQTGRRLLWRAMALWDRLSDRLREIPPRS